MLKTYSKLLQNTVRTISNWKNEHRPIINLLEKYFTKEDIEEFINIGKIEKLELIKNIDIEELKTLIKNKDLLHKVTEIKSLLEDK